MAIISETVRETLISVVGRVRRNKASLSFDRVCDLTQVSTSKLNEALPFIRLSKKRENPERVQCIQQGNKVIGLAPVYSCRIGRCPLLDGNSCLAGQEVLSGKPTDKREFGAPRYSQGTASKRHTSS